MICKACTESYRKGSIVFIAKGKRLSAMRVCPKCASKAYPILPSKQANLCKCGELATTCGKCVDKKELKAKTSDVQVAIAAIRKLLKAYEVVEPLTGQEDYTQGKIEGLEAAAGLLERGSW